MSKDRTRGTDSLIICEGEDEAGVIGAMLRLAGAQDRADVFAANGQGDIQPQVEAAVNTPARVPLRRLAVVRDAERGTEVNAAANHIESTRGILKRYGFPTPTKPLEIATHLGLVGGFVVLPFHANAGTIEDVCLLAVQYPPALACVDSMFRCVADAGVPRPDSITQQQKARTLAYLAAACKGRTVHRCGLGAQHGYFDLDHPAFAPLRTFLADFLAA